MSGSGTLKASPTAATRPLRETGSARRALSMAWPCGIMASTLSPSRKRTGTSDCRHSRLRRSPKSSRTVVVAGSPPASRARKAKLQAAWKTLPKVSAAGVKAGGVFQRLRKAHCRLQIFRMAFRAEADQCGLRRSSARVGAAGVFMRPS